MYKDILYLGSKLIATGNLFQREINIAVLSLWNKAKRSIKRVDNRFGGMRDWAIFRDDNRDGGLIGMGEL